MICGTKPLGTNLAGGGAFPLASRRSRGSNARIRRYSCALKARQNRRVVMFHEDGLGSEVPMNHWLVSCSSFMQLFEGTNCIPCKCQSRFGFPGGVQHPLLDGWRSWVDQREKKHLARISRRVLIRIQNSGHPSMELQPVERVVLS